MSVLRCAACGAVSRSAAASCPRCRRRLDDGSAPQAVDAAALVAAIVSSPAPVLVDFAPPVVEPAPSGEASPAEEAAAATAPEVRCLSVDTAREPAAAAANQVGPGRTLVLFDGGSEVARLPAPRSGAVTGWLAAAAPRELR
jgi:hypothetical protein